MKRDSSNEEPRIARASTDSAPGPILTRRRLLQRAGGGFGLIGLAGLLHQEGLLESSACAAGGLGNQALNPMAPPERSPTQKFEPSDRTSSRHPTSPRARGGRKNTIARKAALGHEFQFEFDRTTIHDVRGIGLRLLVVIVEAAISTGTL